MKDSTHQAAAKRLKRKGMARALDAQARFGRRTSFDTVERGGPVKGQKGSFPAPREILKRGK